VIAQSPVPIRTTRIRAARVRLRSLRPPFRRDNDSTSSMQFARVSHQATLLAGGFRLDQRRTKRGTAIAQSELYNPATGTWSLTGRNVIPRFDTQQPSSRTGESCNGACHPQGLHFESNRGDLRSAKGTWSLTGRLHRRLARVISQSYCLTGASSSRVAATDAVTSSTLRRFSIPHEQMVRYRDHDCTKGVS